MAIVKPDDFRKGVPTLRLIGDKPIIWLMRILKLDEINKAYDNLLKLSNEGIEAPKAILSTFNVKTEVSEADLKNIPAKGAFYTLSNHPFGAIDGVILAHLITAKRPDYKLMANYLLSKVEPLAPYFLPVNPFEEYKDAYSSFKGIRAAMQHVGQGGGLGLFPAGEVSTWRWSDFTISDKPWPENIIKLLVKQPAPIVPIYFEGANSLIFHLLGLIHPRLRTILLPSELVNKTGRTIRVRIGKPIKPDILVNDSLPNVNRILRNAVYKLKYNHTPIDQSNKPGFAEIAQPTEKRLIDEELEKIKGDQLFALKDFGVYCVKTEEIPNIMLEIARQREITFREVGEGTGKPIDTDKYDRYYRQLFIWDYSENKLIGAYRIGLGREILETHGISGFYVHSLFKINRKLEPLLNDTMELGRSFIVRDYQRKATPLFLLWKALFILLVKYDYRYLIGPVSIPGKYSLLTKSLVAEFLNNNYKSEIYSQYFKNRIKTKFSIPKDFDLKAFNNYVGNDYQKLDEYISDIEDGYSTPILVRQYTSVLRTQVLSFNIDPDFNDCLDALMLMDVKNAPKAFLETLSKDLKDYAKIEALLSELI
ncbi:MAG: lysophospholipid acyltransferase family protein [Bacteroidales bacterium]